MNFKRTIVQLRRKQATCTSSSTTRSCTCTTTATKSSALLSVSTSPETFLAQLTPMKRILFICPTIITTITTGVVPRRKNNTAKKANQNQQHDDDGGDDDPPPSPLPCSTPFTFSFAISDAYLSHALPIIIPNNENTWFHYRNPDDAANNSISNSNTSYDFYPSLLSDRDRDRDHDHDHVEQNAIPFNDIGGIVLGLPMKAVLPQQQFSALDLITKNEKDDELISIVDLVATAQQERNIRDSLGAAMMVPILPSSSSSSSPHQSSFLSTFLQRYNIQITNHDNTNTNNDHDINNIPLPMMSICYYNQQLRMDEARKIANEEPEIWEEISDLLGEDDNNTSKVKCLPLPPSPPLPLHAAVGLNSFLWKYTGGWRNTFA